MRRTRFRAPHAWALTVLVASAVAACNAIIGLEPPPPAASTGTAGSGAGGADAGVDSGPPPVCAPLDGGAPDAATYSSLLPLTSSDAGGAWDFFDMASVTGIQPVFSGGAFDGRYVYFSNPNAVVARVDTQGAFDDPASWQSFAVSTAPLDVTIGFRGAIFDGRFVYFVPQGSGTTHGSKVARFDTRASSQSLTDVSAWAVFDTAVLAPDAGPDGGTATSGFWGGTFDGRYVYFAPRLNGVVDGYVVRYDTLAPGDPPPDAGDDAGHPPDAGAEADAGHPADAGDDAGHPSDAGPAADAGHPADAGSGSDAGADDAGADDAGADDAGTAGAGFSDPASWSTFNVATVDPLAIGFAGAVFDGNFVYFVPDVNGAYFNAVNGGYSGRAARLRVDGGSFTDAGSWSTFDVTQVNGLASQFINGAFDGRYVYFVPRAHGIVVRFDTTAGAFDALSAWSSYDLTRLGPPDAGPGTYEGAAFDGRFVYFVPVGNGFATVVRYDTMSTFTADCAWSTADLTQVDAGGLSPENFNGAIFDGTYLYLVPDTNGLAARFKAKTPGSMPDLPAYFGSFW